MMYGERGVNHWEVTVFLAQFLLMKHLVVHIDIRPARYVTGHVTVSEIVQCTMYTEPHRI